MMTNITFDRMQLGSESIVSDFIKSLYKEDASGSMNISNDKIDRTFKMLSEHPDYGTIFVINCESVPIGYSLVINFWSNEYGGLIADIDELYIIPAYRSQGIGSRFINYLRESRSNDLVALELQVLPDNSRALNLYEKLGFEKVDRNHYLSLVNKS